MPRKTPLHLQPWTYRDYECVSKAADWRLSDDFKTLRAVDCARSCQSGYVDEYLAMRLVEGRDDGHFASVEVAVRRLNDGTVPLTELPRGCWPEAWKEMLHESAENVMYNLSDFEIWKDSFAKAANVWYDPVERVMMIRNWADAKRAPHIEEEDYLRFLQPYQKQLAELMTDAQRVYDEIHGTKAASQAASEGTESSDDEDSGRVSDEADETLVVPSSPYYAESDVERTPSPIKRRRLEL